MIGLCIDSNSQIPPALIERYDVEVVPLTVVVDGQEYAEGVDLDADAFYARFPDPSAEVGGTGTPTVSTAAPSPGRFVEAYRRLVERGATEILSVHIGEAISATLSAARMATALADVPVRLVDTGEASFAISCCLWEAAEAVRRGAGIEEAAAVAEATGPRCGNVFVVKALGLARAGGRLAWGAEAALSREGGTGAIPVLSMALGRMTPVGSVHTTDEAADVMAAHVLASGTGLRVGIGLADSGAAPLWQALESRLAGASGIVEVMRYRIGPSVGAHTGPGTAGAVYYPTSRPA